MLGSLIQFKIGKTARYVYFCTATTAACIIIRPLDVPCQWNVLDFFFGLRCYVLSAIFWGALQGFESNCGQIMYRCRGYFKTSIAQRYSKYILDNHELLDRCVGFIYCSKIKIYRSGDPTENQNFCYQGHQKFYCLMYQSITTPDGLILHINRPDDGNRKDIALYHQSNME